MAKSVEDLGSSALGELHEKLSTHQEAQAQVPELTPEEAEEEFRQKRARISQVLSRGILNDKLDAIFKSAVREGWGGKFVRDLEEDVVRHQNLGFGFEYKTGVKTLHDSPDGRVRVGDLVLMTISPEDRSILKGAKEDQVQHKLDAARTEYKRQSAEKPTGASAYDDSQQDIHKGSK